MTANTDEETERRVLESYWSGRPISLIAQDYDIGRNEVRRIVHKGGERRAR